MKEKRNKKAEKHIEEYFKALATFLKFVLKEADNNEIRDLMFDIINNGVKLITEAGLNKDGEYQECDTPQIFPKVLRKVFGEG